MSGRLEVLPGPGTVIRHGNIIVWAGPSASGALLAFLARSAENVGASSRGGRQLVDHVAGILATRDPEPGAPFAAVGPADGGWLAVLHGPVQLWDGVRWLVPEPRPGWLQAPVAAHPALCIGPAQSSPPQLTAESVYDLGEGVVPGGGVLFVPPARATAAPPPAADAWATPGAGRAPGGPVRPDELRTEGDGGEPTRALPVAAPPPEAAPPEAAPPEAAPPPVTAPPGIGPGSAGGPALPGPARDVPRLAPRGRRPGHEAAGGEAPARARPPAGDAAPTEISPTSAVGGGGPAAEVVDLRRPGALPAAPATRPTPPEVAALRCPAGHVNHPGASRCARCGAGLAGLEVGAAPRPPLGILIGDDGSVYRLESDVVVGSDPGGDPSVTAGRAVPIVLDRRDGTVAPAHAEIRLDGWAATVVDRGSAPGTFVVTPGRSDWERLAPFRAAPLRPGSHLSFGRRVFTFVGPWPPA